MRWVPIQASSAEGGGPLVVRLSHADQDFPLRDLSEPQMRNDSSSSCFFPEQPITLVTDTACFSFPSGSAVKPPPAMQETLGAEDSLEQKRATHSSILAWEILWTEEHGRLQSLGSLRVRHDWGHARVHARTHTHTHTHCLVKENLKKIIFLLHELRWKWKSLSRVQFFATPWTIQPMEFSRPEYWSG